MRKWLFFLCVLLVGVAEGAEPRTENTWQLSDGEERPAATLEDIAWFAGAWTGTAFGQQVEENWNAPSAGSMVGMFKLFTDEGVNFYEIMTITEVEGSLSFKVKHFSADFIAWEEKEDYIDFKLVKKEPNAMHFGGISVYRRGEDRIDIYLAMNTKDGIREEHIPLTRVGSDGAAK